MCGSSSTNKSSSRTSDHFNGAYGGALGAEAVRAANRAALARGTNITNSPGYNGGQSKTALGGAEGNAATATPQTPAATPPATVSTVPTAPISAFQEMQAAIDEGETVNAADYSKLGTKAISQANNLENLRDSIEAKNAFSEKGAWAPDTGNPFGMLNQSFQPNRGFLGRAWDALTGKSRTLSMERAIQDTKTGLAADRAADLAAGNTEVDELGKPVKDELGLAVDAISPAWSVASTILSGPTLPGAIATGKSLFGFGQALARSNRLYGDDKDTKATTSPTPSQATAQRTVASSKAVSGMIGSGNERQAVQGALTPTATDDDTTTTATATTKRTIPKTRQSLLLTGASGLQTKPNLLFSKLFGL